MKAKPNDDDEDREDCSPQGAVAVMDDVTELMRSEPESDDSGDCDSAT
jgi:hypothetical protein